MIISFFNTGFHSVQPHKLVYSTVPSWILNIFVQIGAFTFVLEFTSFQSAHKFSPALFPCLPELDTAEKLNKHGILCQQTGKVHVHVCLPSCLCSFSLLSDLVPCCLCILYTVLSLIGVLCLLSVKPHLLHSTFTQQFPTGLKTNRSCIVLEHDCS